MFISIYYLINSFETEVLAFNPKTLDTIFIPKSVLSINLSITGFTATDLTLSRNNVKSLNVSLPATVSTLKNY